MYHAPIQLGGFKYSHFHEVNREQKLLLHKQNMYPGCRSIRSHASLYSGHDDLFTWVKVNFTLPLFTRIGRHSRPLTDE